MTGQELGLEGYPLASQQCGMHAPQWREAAPITVVLVQAQSGFGVPSEALREALDRHIAQHEILRTVYRSVAGLDYPVQQVMSHLTSEWTVLGSEATDEALVHAASRAVQPQGGPVVGAALSASPGGGLRWALAVPAYNLDGVSAQALVASCIAQCARGAFERIEGAEVLQYADYAAWQSKLFAGELGQEGARFWQAQAPSGPTMRLPFETEEVEGAAFSETLELSATAIQSVTGFAQRLGVPFASVLAGVWAGFMARIVPTDRLFFDWDCHARADELEGALGCFVNRLPVSVQIEPHAGAEALVCSVDEHLRQAATWHECFDSAAYLDGLARAGRQRNGLAFSHVRLQDLSPGWSCTKLETPLGGARLRCECVESQGLWHLRWTARPVHSPETVRTWMRQFATLLEGLSVDPGMPWERRSLLGVAEREQILAQAGRPCTAPRTDTLHGLFERQAERDPQAVALVCGEERLSYAALDARARELAGRLRELGAGAEQIVGVHLGRSVHAVTAMLAVLKSGAAYAPLDPAYPADRIALMVADAGISMVITERGERSRWSDLGLVPICVDEELPGQAVGNLVSGTTAPVAQAQPGVGGANLAYLIYTSGSTGRPKGVMVSHDNAVASTAARSTFYPERVSRFLLLSPLSFDSSVAGIFWTLGQGGTLYLPTDEVHRDPNRIADLLVRHSISHILTLPSFYKQILENLEGGGSLRCAVVAGEDCHADVVQLHQRRVPAAALVNEYGPTEGTVWSNAFRIDTHASGGQRIPVGRAIPSMRGYVLDEHLELCPIGVPGEWYIGGDGITRGYRARPGLTGQRFVADPFVAGARLYRTGDRVRQRPDGDVEFLGRVDNQVKLRGHRIELGEVEQILLAHAQVREAVAMVHEDAQLGQRLLAWVEADVGDEAEARVLREALESDLRDRVPAFMVPARLTVMSRFPTMPNGKVDRQGLLATGDQGQRPAFVAPSDEVEQALAQIWEVVLKVERVGLDDSFFDLGGHSLLATQVTARILQRLSAELPLRELFEAATLRDLAARVRAHIDAGQSEAALMEELLADAEAGR